MSDSKIIPWHQYAVISYTATKIEGSAVLGKTAIQKLIYLMEELQGVPVGYRFRLYTYGPYSGDLAEDVTYVEFLGGVVIDFDASQNTYKITSGKEATSLINRASAFMNFCRDRMDRIIQEFGGRKVRDLELLATTVYVAKLLKLNNSYDEAVLREQVRELKPKFTAEDVGKAVTDLQSLKYLPA